MRRARIGKSELPPRIGIAPGPVDGRFRIYYETGLDQIEAALAALRPDGTVRSKSTRQ